MAQNILDVLRKSGVLTDNLQDKLADLLPKDSAEKLSGIFQRYEQLNDEEKQEFWNNALGKLKHSFQDEMTNDLNMYTRFFYSHSYTIFFFAVLLIVLVLVFFVYKLFKCLKQREAKREEKKKIKQMKKKK
ncbi:uncharacterized protein LOC128875696 isoform X2 [Hylaeus volcanicus]|uniref:uncharacterized protein LOC128875696 isoform X2 n=1 Tax=Hylaeus volcanicus TaxID=313075 RepID=UPI0023B79A3C|nr:uncharacterized protein LOC128875696 isoform X2 [Hylaeus volcanicus]